MTDELDGEIEAVKVKIAEVEGEIEKVTKQLERIVEQLESSKQRGEQRPDLEARELRLGKEMERLGTKEHDLREKEKLLIAKQQQGAGCRSWPATILSARLYSGSLLRVVVLPCALNKNDEYLCRWCWLCCTSWCVIHAASFIPLTFPY